ncbi:hypothetical protein H4R34_003920 [Dimargaris verticillata]|uniref:Tim17/Tim22/Tim23/Pmp24 family-domain-containing protein n=1 Tax=Dimargaris verticillata TaxID=2761393 RepID=A0A9W8AZ56_9FUNG|nr:hypothetical protein H4R34_003920 [Dimargaris verticillata]
MPATHTFWDDQGLRRTFQYGTVGIGFLGGTSALFWAIMNNKEPFGRYFRSWGLRFGCVGALFFGVRQSVLYSQRELEKVHRVQPYYFRDYDDMLASLTAGALAGGVSALMSGGKRAAISGMVLGGLTSGLAQWVSTFFRNKRRAYIYEKAQVSSATTKTSHDGLFGQGVELPAEAKSFAKYVNEKFFHGKLSMGMDLPKWSPLRHLTDEDHRQELRTRVEEIDDEVEIIDSELRELKTFYLSLHPEISGSFTGDQ